MTEKMKNKKGFTLVELLVVIGVLAILVLLATPKLLSYLEETQLVKIQHDVKVMEQEMTIALMENEVKFSGWENNDKNLGILVMQNKLFEKEGVAERVDASHLIKKGLLAYSESSDKGLGIGGGSI